MTDFVAAQKERERQFREKDLPFGDFTVREKTEWWNRIELDNVIDRLRFVRGARLLDVRCSDGRLCRRLRARGRGDVIYVG